MPIFKIKNFKLSPIKEKIIDLEKSIQKITEKNLETIFGWELVASEFQVKEFFIDTLAFDPESKSFIIIEYKKDKSFSIIDQGIAYLSEMLNNQDSFIVEYNERSKTNLKRKDIDWSQSRVIFIADSFTRYQRSAIGFKDLPIELWEVKFFEDNLISYLQIKPLGTQGLIKTLTPDKTIRKISKELIYPITYHLNRIRNPKTKELFERLREEIKNNLGSVDEVSRKLFVGYWKENIKFVEIYFQQNRLVLWLRIRGYRLDDPKHLVKELNISEEFWKKIYKMLYIRSLDQISDVMHLIKQAYEKAV